MDGIRVLAVFVSNLKGMGRREKIRHLDWIRETSDFSELTESKLEGLLGNYFSFDRNVMRRGLDDALATAESCGKNGIQIISYLENSYPDLLREIYDPPAVIYARGSFPLPESGSVAIVGTRYPTGRALDAAFETAFALSLNGVNVISGLAMGIDAEAHRGSVAAGGKTAAVLGCGVDMVYPGCNRRIAESIIASGGAILSEYPPGTLPLKYHFPERNRIISGMSEAVILIQAPEKSGALITADYAIEQGRDVLVHSAGLSRGTGLGGIILAEDGAAVVDDVSMIGEQLGFEYKESCLIHGSYFDDPAYAEDEINNLIVNCRGKLYRRMKNA